MGQYDVYDWLKSCYELEPERWFTPQDVMEGLRCRGLSNGYIMNVRTQLIKLAVADMVEYKDLDKRGISNYKKVFRYKPISNEKRR